MSAIFLNITGSLMLCLFAVSLAVGQVDEDDLQHWNDTNIIVNVHGKADLFFPVTFRWTRNVTRFNEGRVGAGIVLKPTKRLSITPFYQLIRARNSAGNFRTENRYHLRAVYRFPVIKFGLSHRSQLEYRDRTTAANTWRYRPSVTIEKTLPQTFIKNARIFATEEPFYDSASGRFSRNRFSIGAGKSFNKNLALDIYYLRQDDNFSGPAVVHVIGTVWKVSL